MMNALKLKLQPLKEWSFKPKNKLKVIVLGAGLIVFLFLFWICLAPNFKTNQKPKEYILVYDTSNFQELIEDLKTTGNIRSAWSLKLMAKLIGLKTNNLKAGRYSFLNNQGNFSFIRNLRNGNQAPLKLTFNNIRNKEQLSGLLSRQLMIDSLTWLNALVDSSNLQELGLEPEEILSIFIPNSYEVFWNITTEKLIAKMSAENKRFWNPERISKANNLGLTPPQVYTVASIVEKESNYKPERPIIAGVYLNRLLLGMPLQADPTVVFANNDFAIKRVLTIHTEFDSPYNTYKYTGLPPGPIYMPDPNTIDAVLNAEKHNYLFFCAKADASGQHVFAETYNQHVQNANIYREYLNKNGY